MRLRERWEDLPLQLRLTLAYILLLAFLFSLLGGILYWQSYRFLMEETAARLRAQAKPVIEAWLYTQTPPDGEPPALPAELHPADAERLAEIAPALARALTSRETVAVLFDAQGHRLADGRRLPEEPTPPAVPASLLEDALRGENEVSAVLDTPDGEKLVLLIPLRAAPGEAQVLGVLELSTPLAPIERILHRQRLLLALLGAITLAVGALLGLWITASGLRDLKRMVATCRRIAAGDLSQRIALPHHRDEVGQLAAAFDEMVSRVEAAFEAQQRFIANAAHELRTPITALQGSLEVLMRGAQDDPAACRRLTAGMYREATRLSRLCEQLLDLSRLQAAPNLNKQRVELAPFFAAFTEQARRLAEEGVTVVLEEGERGAIAADPDALTRILFNLVANAIQHNAPPLKVTLGWRREGGEVVLFVADNGQGIPAEDLPHLFEPFYTADRSRSRRRSGTGLGLALTKALVEAHGGTIRLFSREGEGTRVEVRLPALPGP